MWGRPPACWSGLAPGTCPCLFWPGPRTACGPSWGPCGLPPSRGCAPAGTGTAMGAVTPSTGAAAAAAALCTKLVAAAAAWEATVCGCTAWLGTATATGRTGGAAGGGGADMGAVLAAAAAAAEAAAAAAAAGAAAAVLLSTLSAPCASLLGAGLVLVGMKLGSLAGFCMVPGGAEEVLITWREPDSVSSSCLFSGFFSATASWLKEPNWMSSDFPPSGLPSPLALPAASGLTSSFAGA